MNFTDDRITRYSRHILLPEVGGKGQKKIAQARILIVGAGGLGSPVALYLAAAGMGTIGLIDKDVVDLSNLQRQVIHHTSEQTVCELRPPVAATHGIKQKRAGEPP
jgi:molybdopterin-synthase adenylyltransferase